MNRRFFLLAAPAIVAAPSLMKVSALVASQEGATWYSGYETLAMTESDLVTAMIRARLPYLIRNITQTNALYRHLIEKAQMQDRVFAEVSGTPDILRG